MNENTELTGTEENLEENLDFEQLQQKIKELEGKAASNWDMLLRAKADEENLRKRSRLDIENAHKYAIEKFARSMLDIVDSLERGIELSNNEAIDNEAVVIKSLKDGMELTLKLLLDNLDQFGIKMLNPKGEAFNPTQHEALAMQEQSDIPPNSVISVIQKGFVIHERILRPARVIVSKRT